MDKDFRNWWGTDCKKDYHKRHFWEKLGIVFSEDTYYLLWRCSQCQLCLEEELETIYSQNINNKNDGGKDGI